MEVVTGVRTIPSFTFQKRKVHPFEGQFASTHMILLSKCYIVYISFSDIIKFEISSSKALYYFNLFNFHVTELTMINLFLLIM